MFTQFFTLLMFSLVLNASVEPQMTPWRPARPEETSLKNCLALNSQTDHRLCILSKGSASSTGLQVIEMKSGNQARRLLALVDTTKGCEGKTLGAASFYGFEQKDANGDGNPDAVVLINSGKEKRKPTESEPCPHPKVRTAIYELVYLNHPEGVELYKPSELVVERLQSFNVLDRSQPKN